MSFNTKKHLSRRTFLRGTGVVMALPLLESMVPAGTALAQTAAAAKTRLGAIYFPHGAIMPKWTPAGNGPDFELTEILQPLKAYKDRLTIVSGLSHALAYGSGATANHNRSTATFLSGAFAKVGAQPQLGVTMDQVAAQKIGQGTPIPSIELMIEDSSVNCGDGLSCAYRDTMAWQGPSSPLPMQNNPQVVFERLFGDGATAELRATRRQQSLSLLDSVLGEAASLQKALPASDRLRMDRYLSDVREIERRIEQAGKQMSEAVEMPPAPAGIPRDVEEHIKLMFDLQVLAWQADITRVSTFLLAKELSTAVYAKSGIRDPFHTLSHHSNVQQNKDRFAVLNMYHVALFGYFLEKLQGTPDGNGTLLDHSMVLYGSAMSDGNQHNHSDLPLIVAGGASGRLKGNRHLRYPVETPMANLLVAMLNKLEIPTEKFGDSNGSVSL
jgi:hypothetical protein